MKNIKGFTLGLVLGLALALSGVGLAQNTSQTGNQKEKQSCCSMESCCCKGDSCAMKHESKDNSSKDGCCCCSGDSCKMKMKDKHKQG